jgi:exodeoxyribonuclease VII large subunit
MTRTAISPRLAIKTLRNTPQSYHATVAPRSAHAQLPSRPGFGYGVSPVAKRTGPPQFDVAFGAIPGPREEREVLGVAALDRMLKQLVEGATQNVRVVGEVSGLHRASSGHVYFTLKDEREDALVDCVMYRGATSRGGSRLAEGERVVVEGRVTVYAPRGRLQLVLEAVLEAGRGELLEALERLKAKLQAEGLFERERKKPLPREPKRIAVLTSRDGAAIHDICRVAFSRGAVSILLVPTPVQGQGAGERIARAVRWTDRLPGIDAIVVTRGGGSLEDLSAYNDEVLVRAIAEAKTPIVTAVGHEVDTSLCDLVADVRAATPSQAAELLVPDSRERLEALEHLGERLARGMRHRLTRNREQLVRLERRLGEPRRRLLEEAQRIDDALSHLERAILRHLKRDRERLVADSRKLDAQHPRRVLGAAREQLAPLLPRLDAAMRRRIESSKGELGSAAARLDAMSPLAVLARGYALATTREGRVLRRATELAVGDAFKVRLEEGSVSARVEATHDR